MHDLVIRNGLVVDGTGEPARHTDIAIDEGAIAAVGDDVGAGHREIDADGRLVTPGWVDIHTHYDGQVTWDPEVTPSSWHGVTTVVMGNCGVGFAPVRPGAEQFLIEVMEGVEDIPGTALAEGIDWQWESFGEYLDALDATPRVLDIAAQVPHAAVRAYVMGERAHDAEATDDDLTAMARITREALAAGAVGFTTSRTITHASRHGFVPGTTAPPDELAVIAEAIREAGHGVFELVSDQQFTDPERSWLTAIARDTGIPVTFALAQVGDPTAYRDALAEARRLGDDGVRVVPQVSTRPTGMLFGLQSTLHPFVFHPTYKAIADLPLAERAARLRDPAVRDALLAEQSNGHGVAGVLVSRWHQIFPLGDPPDYEPPASASVAAVAAREGRAPEAVVLDWLLERDGKALLFAPLASYHDHDHEAVREMISDPNTVLGLSDGGAHCGLICDASMTTYLLTHWVRDRTRGPRIGLEQAVSLQTSRTAALYGFSDRGVLAPGKRADINVIDHDALTLHAPEMVFDLPAGGRRLVQHVDGYDATIVAGEVTFEAGEPTGARPGQLVRGGR